MTHFAEIASDAVIYKLNFVKIGPDIKNNKNKQTPWPLFCERTIPTERPPLVDEIYCHKKFMNGIYRRRDRTNLLSFF
jgi:hypothetical protein